MYLRGDVSPVYVRTIAHPMTGTQVGVLQGESDDDAIARYNVTILGFTPTAPMMPGGQPVAPSPSTYVGPTGLTPSEQAPLYQPPPPGGGITISYPTESTPVPTPVQFIPPVFIPSSRPYPPEEFPPPGAPSSSSGESMLPLLVAAGAGLYFLGRRKRG
jgi:hypothetical protein